MPRAGETIEEWILETVVAVETETVVAVETETASVNEAYPLRTWQPGYLRGYFFRMSKKHRFETFEQAMACYEALASDVKKQVAGITKHTWTGKQDHGKWIYSLRKGEGTALRFNKGVDTNTSYRLNLI